MFGRHAPHYLIFTYISNDRTSGSYYSTITDTNPRQYLNTTANPDIVPNNYIVFALIPWLVHNKSAHAVTMVRGNYTHLLAYKAFPPDFNTPS